MKNELDEKLVKAFPLLYGDRNAPMKSTAMCWGFSCGDGWFDIIWELSSKLEPIIQKFIDGNPDLGCSVCGCEKGRHYACKTRNPGRCLAIHEDPDNSDEPPPGNYYACFCDKYISDHPKAVQVKEKFGGLRFYMTHGNDEIFNLISEAESKSYVTCEECGESGSQKDTGWVKTLCDSCHESWGETRKKWKKKMSKSEDRRIAIQKKGSAKSVDEKTWVVKIERLDVTTSDGNELCVKFPDELMGTLGWEIGDEVEWERTEIWDDRGDHPGYILRNLTKEALD